MTYPHEFALLAPVPLEHLQSGKDVAQQNKYVAFGSMKFEFFRDLKVLWQGHPVLAMLYASHEGDLKSPPFKVAWKGWFTGSEEIIGGKSNSEWKNRPPTCRNYPRDNARHWAVFWHISNLEPLSKEQQFPVHQTRGYKLLKTKKDSPPRYPQLIDWPVI